MAVPYGSSDDESTENEDS